MVRERQQLSAGRHWRGLNGEVLIIGTPGHNKKPAVPIRELDVTSELRNYFDFPADSRRATNSPAVLLAANETLASLRAQVPRGQVRRTTSKELQRSAAPDGITGWGRGAVESRGPGRLAGFRKNRSIVGAVIDHAYRKQADFKNVFSAAC